jgi:hypothetical protein
MQQRQPADQRQIVLQRLAETNPRIDDDPSTRDAGRRGRRNAI